MSSRKRKRNSSPSSQEMRKKNDKNSNIYNMEEKTQIHRRGRPPKHTVVEKVNVNSLKNEISKSENKIKDVYVVLTRIDDSMSLFPSSPRQKSTKSSPESPKNLKPEMHDEAGTSSSNNTLTPRRMKRTSALVLKTESGTIDPFSGQVNNNYLFNTKSEGSVCNREKTNCDRLKEGPSLDFKKDSPKRRRSIKVESENPPTPENPVMQSVSVKKYSRNTSPNKSNVQISSPYPKMKTFSIMCEKLLVDSTGAIIKNLSASGSSPKSNKKSLSPTKSTRVKHEAEESSTSEQRFVIQTRKSKLSMSQKVPNSDTSNSHLSESLQGSCHPAKTTSENSKLYVSPRSRRQRGTLKQCKTVVKVSLSRPKTAVKVKDNVIMKASPAKGKLNTNHLVSMVKTVRTASKLKSASKCSKQAKNKTNILACESDIVSEDVQTVCGVIIQNSDNFPVEMGEDDNSVNPVMMVNEGGDNGENPVNAVNNSYECVNMLNNGDDGVKMVNNGDGAVNDGDDGVNSLSNGNDGGDHLVNMVNNGDDTVKPVNNSDDSVLLVNVVNNGVNGVNVLDMMNNGDDGVNPVNMATDDDDLSPVNTVNNYDSDVAEGSSIFSNEEFLASLPPIEDDTLISKQFQDTEMLPSNLNMPGKVDEDLQISEIPEMALPSIGTSVDVSPYNQSILSGKHKEAINFVSYLNPENTNSTQMDITKKTYLDVNLYGQLSETSQQSTIMQNDLLESRTSFISNSVNVPNEPDSHGILEYKENKSESGSNLKSLSQSPDLSVPIESQIMKAQDSETLTEAQDQRNDTENSLNTNNESKDKFRSVVKVCNTGNPPPTPKNIVKIKVAFASAKSVLDQIKAKNLDSFLDPKPGDGVVSMDEKNNVTPSLLKTALEQQETVVNKPQPTLNTSVPEEPNVLPNPEDAATEIQNSPGNNTENFLTKSVGASFSNDRNYILDLNKAQTDNTGTVNSSSESEIGTCTNSCSYQKEKEVNDKTIGVNKTPITQGCIPNTNPSASNQDQGSQIDVTKYQNILTPEVLKQILALSNSVTDKERKPQMLKLPNGSLIKLNFSKLGKEEKSSTITNDSSSKPVSKSKKIRKPKFPPGWVCPVEPAQGERIATYQSREEMNNLIVKCPTCSYYHCPLCEFQRFKPQSTKERVFQHIDLIHWSRQVPVIINEKEYFTVICNLLHGKNVYKKSHLHCPCGIVVRYHDKKERFQYHRKYICPLTAHIRKKKGILVRKKRTPTCFKKEFPDNQHRSIHDTWEDLLSCMKKCSLCEKFHCFICPETKFLPASRSHLVKHLKSHYDKRIVILTTQGELGPFILACKMKHADIRNKHYHCLCGQILKTTLNTFREHVKNCQVMMNGFQDKGNYTQMNIYEYEGMPLDQQAMLSTIQLRMMIPRNTVPIYGHNGQKLLPPPLRSGIFRNVQELCSVAKRCYTCCTQYHCPLCPANTFRPSNRTKLASHLLRTHHKFKLPLPSGLFSYPCSLSHNGVQQRHYHCACDYLPTARLRFLKHVSVCSKAALPLDTPQLEEMCTTISNEMKVKEIQDLAVNVITERVDMNPLNQIFENSDDEDEDEDILALGKKLSQTLYNDHAYLHCKEDLAETLEDHLEAKSAVNEIVENLPEIVDDSKDNNASVEPMDAMLRSQEWFATNHEITNTCMSDPSRGLFNPFDLVAAQVKKCEDCCKNYHCPYCPPMYFKPNSRNAVIRHMKTHWAKRVILIDGTFALPCFINHYQMLNMHYHCLCGAIVESNSSFFYSHIKACKFVIGMAEDCQSGLQPLCQQIGENLDSNLADTGFQSLDKVATELSSFLEENTKQSKNSAARNSSSKADINHPHKSGHWKTNSPKPAKTLAPKPLETEAHVEQRVIADVIENYVEDDWMITASNSAEVSTNTTHFSPEFACTMDEVQGLGVPSMSNVTLQYEGMNYDIVVPHNGGVLDMNALQGILPPGYSYMLID